MLLIPIADAPPRPERLMTFVRRLIAVSLFALLGVSCGSRPPEKTRIVVVTLDTLRADALPMQENAETSMPMTSEWAKSGAVFHQFYASTSTTQPTHATMFTGLHPWQHGVTRNGQHLRGEFTTVAEILSAAGYSTAASVASFPVSSAFGFDQGFQVFEDDFQIGTVGDGWLEYAGNTHPEGYDDDEAKFYSLANHVVDRAIDLLSTTTGDHQFFWFHFFDPHDPYGDTATGPVIGPNNVLKMAENGKDPAPGIAKARRLYRLDVQYMDQQLQRLLSFIDASADDFETHVILVSDHGESLGEDGSMGHGSRLTPEQIHIPCCIRSPLIEPDHRFELAGSIDIAATIVSFAGLAPDFEQSRDLSKDTSAASPVYGMRRTYKKWQMRRRLDGKQYPVGDPLFYEVSAGREIVKGNSQRVWSDAEIDAETTRRLKSLFSFFEEQLDQNVRDEELDQSELEALRALGYVD